MFVNIMTASHLKLGVGHLPKCHVYEIHLRQWTVSNVAVAQPLNLTVHFKRDVRVLDQ